MKKEIYFRTCNLFLFDQNNSLIVQKRLADENPFPGYWDASPGGVVRINETDLEAIMREIREEMGVVPVNVTKLATKSIENEGWFWWSTFFRGECKDQVTKHEEVQEYRAMPLQEIEDMIKAGEKFTPTCLSGLSLIRKS